MKGCTVTRFYQIKKKDGTIIQHLGAGAVQSMASCGMLDPHDSVAEMGTTEWKPVRKLRGFVPNKSEQNPIEQQEPSPSLTKPQRNIESVISKGKLFSTLIKCSESQGSGIIISQDGYVITNNHVVESADIALVSIPGKSDVKALVLHRHSEHDLAILKMATDVDSFLNLETDCSLSPLIGEDVFVLGYPCGLEFSVTKGIISEPQRKLEYGTFVQTDASINPGNSGGALLDSQGLLIGVNTSVRRDSQGIGFAIPCSVVREYWIHIQNLVNQGNIVVPTDREIVKQKLPASLHERILEAIALRGMAAGDHEEHILDDGIMESQYCFYNNQEISIYFSNVYFRMSHFIDFTISPRKAKNSAFLFGLFEIQNILYYARFQLSENEDDTNYTLKLICSLHDQDITAKTISSHFVDFIRFFDELNLRVQRLLH